MLGRGNKCIMEYWVNIFINFLCFLFTFWMLENDVWIQKHVEPVYCSCPAPWRPDVKLQLQLHQLFIHSVIFIECILTLNLSFWSHDIYSVHPGEGSSSVLSSRVLTFSPEGLFGNCSWFDVRSKVRNVCVQIVKHSETNLWNWDIQINWIELNFLETFRTTSRSSVLIPVWRHSTWPPLTSEALQWVTCSGKFSPMWSRCRRATGSGPWGSTWRHSLHPTSSCQSPNKRSSRSLSLPHRGP